MLVHNECVCLNRSKPSMQCPAHRTQSDSQNLTFEVTKVVCGKRRVWSGYILRVSTSFRAEAGRRLPGPMTKCTGSGMWRFIDH
jgi:hypothetical protein